MNKKLCAAATAASAALAAMSVAAAAVGTVFIPGSIDTEAGGIVEALAGGLAAALASVALLAILFIVCAVALVFAALSFVALLRVCLGRQTGTKTVVVLYVSLTGTAAALFGGIFMCLLSLRAGVTAAGAVLIAVAALHGAACVAFAVKLTRERRAPLSEGAQNGQNEE